jgi:hypothetical protein
LHLLDGDEKISNFIGAEVCESWDEAIRDDKHVTGKERFDIDQGIGKWCIVEDLATRFRDQTMQPTSREHSPGL